LDVHRYVSALSPCVTGGKHVPASASTGWLRLMLLVQYTFNWESLCSCSLPYMCTAGVIASQFGRHQCCLHQNGTAAAYSAPQSTLQGASDTSTRMEQSTSTYVVTH
jgi:hypothetical protein